MRWCLSLSVMAEDCPGALQKKRIEPQDKVGVRIACRRNGTAVQKKRYAQNNKARRRAVHRERAVSSDRGDVGSDRAEAFLMCAAAPSTTPMVRLSGGALPMRV